MEKVGNHGIISDTGRCDEWRSQEAMKTHPTLWGKRGKDEGVGRDGKREEIVRMIHGQRTRQGARASKNSAGKKEITTRDGCWSVAMLITGGGFVDRKKGEKKTETGLGATRSPIRGKRWRGDEHHKQPYRNKSG